jgi:multidrug resistance efflux pump
VAIGASTSNVTGDIIVTGTPSGVGLVRRVSIDHRDPGLPDRGIVTHAQPQVRDIAIDRGAQHRPGHTFWVYGYFEETQIQGVHIGDPARIKLMGYRQTLTGQVESITRGITDQDSQIDRYGLPDVNPVFTWVRLAQRIPVRIAIESVPPGILLASGMTCSVSVADAANLPNTPFGRLFGLLQDYL